MRLKQNIFSFADGGSKELAQPDFTSITGGDQTSIYNGIKLIWDKLTRGFQRIHQAFNDPTTGIEVSDVTITGNPAGGTFVPYIDLYESSTSQWRIQVDTGTGGGKSGIVFIDRANLSSVSTVMSLERDAAPASGLPAVYYLQPHSASERLIIGRLGSGTNIYELNVDHIRERNSSDANGERVNYTSTWTTDGVAPAIGNGTITATYERLNGRMVQCNIGLTWGSTTTGGTGNWFFSVPFQSATTYERGTGLAFDLSLVQVFTITAAFGDANRLLGFPNAGFTATATTPFTWATGDTYTLTILYETI